MNIHLFNQKKLIMSTIIKIMEKDHSKVNVSVDYVYIRRAVITQVAQQAVTETTKSFRAKGETHGIPHRSGHHGSRRN